MKLYRIARLTILMSALAISSPEVRAQSAPAAEIPSADTTPFGPPVSPLSSSPFSEYTPPTEKEKLRRFELDAFGPAAFAKVAGAGAWQQARNSPPEWGGGWDAYRTRVASSFGTKLVATTTRYGMAEILHEDTAYYSCQCSGFFPRVGHALISTLTGRHGQDGHTVFSFPRLVSPYAGAMTSLAWYPDRYGMKDGIRMGSVSLASQAVGNLALEFIFRGPRSLLSHFGRSNSPDRTTVSRTRK
jgi:hypothetical protein